MLTTYMRKLTPLGISDDEYNVKELQSSGDTTNDEGVGYSFCHQRRL